MTFSLIAHSAAGSPTSNGFSMSAMDTTGADLLIVPLNWYNQVSNPVLTDSYSNVLTGLTPVNFNGSSTAQILYAKNPTVGSSHVFSTSGLANYNSIYPSAWSGSDTSAPFDVESGAPLVFGTSVQAGSVTPSAIDSLIISFIGRRGYVSNEFSSIDSGFTILDDLGSGNGLTFLGGASSYLIETSIVAKNPTWSWMTNDSGAALNAVFKPVSQDTIIALTGVEATGALGSVSPTFAIPTSGVGSTGSPGSLVGAGTFGLTGVSSTGSVGTLSPTALIPLSGVEGTGDVGTLTPTLETFVALTGVQGTGGVGSLGVTFSLALIGNSGSGHVGSFTPVGTFGILIDSPRILTPQIIGEVSLFGGLIGTLAIAGKPRMQQVVYAASVTLDCSLYDVFDFAPLGGAVSITLSGMSDGQKVELSIPQGSGSHAVSFTNTLIFGTDVTALNISTAAGAIDELILRYKDSVPGFRVLAVSHAYTN